MDFYFFEISLATVAVIVTWMGCKAIKGIWTGVKRRISYMVGKSQDNQGVANLNASESLASSSEPHRWKYDVFLSFRGPDTRKGIANEICNRLCRSGIITFMDEHGLQVGDVISPTLINAIKESRFAIVILSKNYASSAWCLEELREICQSMEDNRILPFFYHVDPTDVRYQKRSFEEAFSKHDTSGRHESEKVEQWRAALEKVANISGWNTNDFKTHEELVDNIVESLRSKVTPDAIEFTDDFQAFGATKEATDKVMKSLTDDNITAVGVYGMGGVGKTSMVRHVAAQACINGTFNHWIMAVVSQNLDLKKIQDTLADLLGFELKEKTEAGRADKLHKEIMRKEKLLIIVDDVWERTELSKIGIPTYNELQKCKSKVLLTTRRLNVCNAMKCHEKINLKVLSDQDSWTLFVRNAGTISFEPTSFEKVARRVAGECKGLPIALIAVARALGDVDQEEWEKAAKRLEQSQYVNPNYGCKLLQSLFASDVAQCLVQLEDLLVEWCPLLERVMEAVNKEKTVLPKLKKLVLKKLPMLYGAIAAVDIECPSLEHLMVVGCPKLLFSTSSDLFEAFKSRNQFSFSASTSDPVQLHDPQLYKTLRDRTSL